MEILINNQLKTFSEQQITVQELVHREVAGKQQGKMGGNTHRR
jgi:hypothetical protein